MLVNMTGSVIS